MTDQAIEWVDGLPGRRFGPYARFIAELRAKPGQMGRVPMGKGRTPPQGVKGASFYVRTIDGERWLYGIFDGDG